MCHSQICSKQKRCSWKMLIRCAIDDLWFFFLFFFSITTHFYSNKCVCILWMLLLLLYYFSWFFPLSLLFFFSSSLSSISPPCTLMDIHCTNILVNNSIVYKKNRPQLTPNDRFLLKKNRFLSNSTKICDFLCLL